MHTAASLHYRSLIQQDHEHQCYAMLSTLLYLYGHHKAETVARHEKRILRGLESISKHREVGMKAQFEYCAIFEISGEVVPSTWLPHRATPCDGNPRLIGHLVRRKESLRQERWEYASELLQQTA